MHRDPIEIGVGEPLRILLVEDNAADSKWFQLTLDDLQFPYVLEIVETGDAALRFLRESQQAHTRRMPDLMFLDLNLPGLTGGEVLEIWRTESDRDGLLPICVLTSSTLEREDLTRRFQIQAPCYLLKPVRAETLLAALECFDQFKPLAKRIRASLTPGNWQG